VISKRWDFKRLHFFVGTSSRVGVELTYDFGEPALTIHVLNVWLVIEVW